jgi:hypothetical protein
MIWTSEERRWLALIMIRLSPGSQLAEDEDEDANILFPEVL